MMPVRRVLLALVAVTALYALCASCGLTSADDENNGPGQQDAAVFDPNTLEGGIDQPPPDPNCHEQTFEPEKVGDPDIMIVMDKSGSMQEGSPSKYTQTSAAVTTAVTGGSTEIQWGLIFFPSNGDCSVGSAPDVGVGPDGATQIPGILTGTSPNGNTPAYKAIDLATQYYNTLVDERAHYILLATDGMPNCEGETPAIPVPCQNDAACTAEQYCELTGMPPPFPAGLCMPKPKDLAITSISTALANGVKTYVVGIDIDSGVAGTLNRMAEAGGTARAGTTKYYPVSDQASLEQALANITLQIISCTFALDQEPPAPEYIGVSVGAQSVPRDPTRTAGWEVDAASRTLTFYGEACTALQANPDAVSVTFACTPID